MSASHLAKEFWPIFFCFILGQPKVTHYVFKLALKNDDCGGRQNSPLDGASCLSQRSQVQPGKWIRYNEGTIGIEVLVGHFKDMCFIKFCTKLF